MKNEATPNKNEVFFGVAGRIKAAVHWVRVNALSAESSPNLTLAAMGLRAD